MHWFERLGIRASVKSSDAFFMHRQRLQHVQVNIYYFVRIQIMKSKNLYFRYVVVHTFAVMR